MTEETNKYDIQGNRVLIEDQEIVFDFPIYKSVMISGMLIVLLNIPVEVKYTENVFGVSLVEKKIKWQIEKREFAQAPFTHIPCKYNGIAVYENKLRLNNWCSAYLIVKPTNGEVLEEGQTR